MMRIIIFLAYSIFLFFSTPTTFGNDIDPEEAILGSWIVDQVALTRLQESTTDEATLESIERMRSVYDMNSFSFYRDGSVAVTPGVSGSVQLRTDDNGVLHVESDDLIGYFPTAIRFLTMDRFETLPNPDGRLAYSVPFRRQFSSEVLEGDSLHQPTIDKLMGQWRLDDQRLMQMDWVQSIKHEISRQREIDRVKAGDGQLDLSISPNRISLIDPHTGRSEGISITFIGADEIAVAIGIDTHPGLKGPLHIARIDVYPDDHIEVWEDGRPFPMSRIEDKGLADDSD